MESNIYFNKYIKYKNKYITLRNQYEIIGGGPHDEDLKNYMELINILTDIKDDAKTIDLLNKWRDKVSKKDKLNNYLNNEMPKVSDYLNKLVAAKCNKDCTIDKLIKSALELSYYKNWAEHLSPLHYALTLNRTGDIIKLLITDTNIAEFNERGSYLPIYTALLYKYPDEIIGLLSKLKPDIIKRYHDRDDFYLHEIARRKGYSDSIVKSLTIA